MSLDFYTYSIWLGGEPPLQQIEKLALQYQAYNKQFEQSDDAIVPVVVLDASAMNKLQNNPEVLTSSLVKIIDKNTLTVDESAFISKALKKPIMHEHASKILKIEAHGDVPVSYIPIVEFGFNQKLIESFKKKFYEVYPSNEYRYLFDGPNLPLKTIDKNLQEGKFVAAADLVRLLMLIVFENGFYYDIDKIPAPTELTPEILKNVTNKFGSGFTPGATLENQALFSTDYRKVVPVLTKMCQPSAFCSIYPKKLDEIVNEKNVKKPGKFQHTKVDQEKLADIQKMNKEFRDGRMQVLGDHFSSLDKFKKLALGQESVCTQELISLYQSISGLESICHRFEAYSRAAKCFKNNDLYEPLHQRGKLHFGQGSLHSSALPCYTFMRSFRYAGGRILALHNNPRDLRVVSSKNMLQKVCALFEKELGVKVSIEDMMQLAVYAFKVYHTSNSNKDDLQLESVFQSISRQIEARKNSVSLTKDRAPRETHLFEVYASDSEMSLPGDSMLKTCIQNKHKS